MKINTVAELRDIWLPGVDAVSITNDIGTVISQSLLLDDLLA
jgi:hypothetical protein